MFGIYQPAIESYSGGALLALLALLRKTARLAWEDLPVSISSDSESSAGSMEFIASVHSSPEEQ